MRRGALLALALVVLAGPIEVASAQAPNGDEQKARTLFSRGERYFSLGRFTEALDAYKGAYDAYPLPGFHFNVAQCYRNLGDNKSALHYYKRYLDEDPNATNRAAVERVIKRLEKQIAEDKRESSDTKLTGGGGNNNNTGGGEGGGKGNGGGGGQDDTGNGNGNGTGQVDTGDRPFYKNWKFWVGAAAVSAAGAGTTYYFLTRDNAPATDLGNLDFGK